MIQQELPKLIYTGQTSGKVRWRQTCTESADGIGEDNRPKTGYVNGQSKEKR